MNNQRTSLLGAIVLATLAAPSARAIDVAAGKWTLSFDGNVNAHYIYSNCESHPDVVGGGLACVASRQLLLGEQRTPARGALGERRHQPGRL